MKFSKQVLALAVGSAVSLGAVHSFASVVPGVFNTGVNGSNALLAGGATDTHFDLGLPPTPGDNPVVTSPLGAGWVADTATAQWISLTADQSGAGDGPGAYYYNEQFNLSNYITNDPTDDPIEISGKWASANPGGGNDILLNGNPINLYLNQGLSSALTSFDLKSGDADVTFNSGVNTLSFLANTQGPPPTFGGPGGPEGVLVDSLQVTATLSPDPLPEPATIGLLGLGAMGLLSRRKRA